MSTLASTISPTASLSNMGTDILVFIASEILVNLIFTRANGRDSNIRLFLTQGVLLFAVSVLLFVLHHAPYILGLITLFIFTRLVVTVATHPTSENAYVSRPLRYTPEVNEHELLDEQQSQPWNYFSNHHQQKTVAASPCTTETSNDKPQPMSWSQSASVPLTRRTVWSVSPFMRSAAPPHRRVSPALPPLQRPPISSISPRMNQNQSSGLQFFCNTTTSLGYISSLLDTPRPSDTPPGLINTGNICFINSTLQCLSWTAGFSEVLPSVSSGSETENGFIKSLNSVLHLCHQVPDGQTRFSPVNSSELQSSLSTLVPHLVVTPGGGTYQSQQDAAEFLLWLLDCLHGVLQKQNGGKTSPLSEADISHLLSQKQALSAELEKKMSVDIHSLSNPLIRLSETDWQLHWQRNASPLYELFLGQLVEARECQHCQKISVSMEYFTILPLPVPVAEPSRTFALQDCFNHFGEVEDLGRANMLRCSCTGLEQSSQSLLTLGKRLARLSKPPKRLVIQLTRFSYDSFQKVTLKNTTRITLPLTLDLYPYTIEAKLNKESKSIPYHLYALCTHTGAQSTSFGHYVAHCKTTNGSWYYFNDKNVAHIADMQTELGSTFVLRNAYLLFYTREEM